MTAYREQFFGIMHSGFLRVLRYIRGLRSSYMRMGTNMTCKRYIPHHSFKIYGLNYTTPFFRISRFVNASLKLVLNISRAHIHA